MLVWSLSVTVAYNDGSWSGSDYTFHEGVLLTSGPDVSSLPEIKSLWSSLGMNPKVAAPFRTDYNSIVFRFMSIYTNSHVHVLGSTEHLEIISDNAQAVIGALASEPYFSAGFLSDGSVIQSILANLNSRHTEVTDLVQDLNHFDDGYTTTGDEFPLGSGVFLHPNGKTYWCGMSNERNMSWVDNDDWEGHRGNLIRFNADGTLDRSFNQPAFSGNDNGFVRRIAMRRVMVK